MRCGRWSAAICLLRLPESWRSGAAQPAGSSRSSSRADTRPSGSIPRRRADRTTRVSSSKASSPRSRSTRRSRAPHSITCVDPGRVLDQLVTMLPSGGRVVVVEWAWERFDEATAKWCFARIEEHGSSWLHRHRDQWVASGREWDQYLHSFASAPRAPQRAGAASRSRRTAGSSALGGRAVLLRRPSGDDRLGGAGGHRGGGDPAVRTDWVGARR